MGLFDDVRCEYPLPSRAHQGLNFQTKDLESLMDRYVKLRAKEKVKA